MTTLQEFLEGEPLEYRGFNYKWHTAVYRVGIGTYIYRGHQTVCVSKFVKSDELATRFFYNQMKDQQNEES